MLTTWRPPSFPLNIHIWMQKLGKIKLHSDPIITVCWGFTHLSNLWLSVSNISSTNLDSVQERSVFWADECAASVRSIHMKPYIFIFTWNYSIYKKKQKNHVYRKLWDIKLKWHRTIYIKKKKMFTENYAVWKWMALEL